MELICKASAKYAPMTNEICEPLFELLRNRNALEKEIFERNEQLNIEREKVGISKNIVAPGWDELIKEYRKRMYELLKDNCTEKLLSRGYAIFFGKPQEFGYIDDECTAEFKMRYADKASIETHYTKVTVKQKHKFVMRLVDGKWLIDELYYGFENEKSWYIQSF